MLARGRDEGPCKLEGWSSVRRQVTFPCRRPIASVRYLVFSSARQDKLSVNWAGVRLC
jgi:hypothetical protein